MQFPRRNVDFSNLGLIGRRREEKLYSALIADRIRQVFGFACLALSRLRSFLAHNKGQGHTLPVSDRAKLHHSRNQRYNRGYPSSI